MQMPINYHRLIVAALPVIVSPGAAVAQTVAIWPDTFLARVEATAIVETLNATLLAAHSATFTLDAWCADHKLGSETKIRARLVRDVDKPVTAEQRQHLQVSDDEPVKFRHLELACGNRVLSEADNWYVPSRLTAEMNRLLETTDTPFGRAVADLKPSRQTFAVEILWKPLPDGWEGRSPGADHPERALDIPHRLFAHRALLFTPERKPISEVEETYTGDNLPFTPPR
jgi:chorismate-pyruvate lyase